MPVFAAVDIGANSVRLKIAELRRGRLRELHEDREVTRLGEAVFRTGALAPDAIARTVKVLRRFHKAAQEHGADAVRVVATSALRDARNARAFLEWVASATGWNVEVISGLEEGRLIHLGIMGQPRAARSRVLLMDLGGGSCEVTVSVNSHIKQMFSLPLGAVRLTQEFLKHDPPTRRELERLREFVVREVRRTARHVSRVRLRHAIATSGTAAALAEQHHAGRKNRSGLVPTRALERMAEELAEMPQEERMELIGIGPRRAEIIIAGAVVFAELHALLGLKGFRYSPIGLRDGVLAQMAADYDRSTRSRKQIESERRDALQESARHYHVDLAHAERVKKTALELFDTLKSVHGLSTEYRDWLEAAAMLHEVGAYVNRAGRHRHTYYIIANSEIFGYTPQQRRLIATIARYIGKSRPASDERPLKQLAPGERKHLPRAVVLLRMAAALNQGRSHSVTHVRPRIKDGRVTLVVRARRRADLELWALSKERGYFREVFGRELAAALS
jgi:exopolyphosphatase/guanosine-5'-triphosphate,3'-diphosphate pyrophosphatase